MTDETAIGALPNRWRPALGQLVTPWRTGLGFAAGDEAAAPIPGGLQIPASQLLLGGRPAKIVYSGRSGCYVTDAIPTKSLAADVSLLLPAAGNRRDCALLYSSF